MSTTRADRTAIRRTALSRPVALALDDGLIHEERSFFDYGCGRGDDLLRLHKMGIPVSGWDPAFFPDEERTSADVVNLGYVVNVIEDPADRIVVLAAAWELARQVLIVSARLDWEATDACSVAESPQPDEPLHRLRQRRRVVTDPFLEDQRHVAYLRLPAQRVAVDDDQVGQLARLDGAELLVLARHAGSVFPTLHGFTK